MPINLSPDQLARLQRNLGSAANTDGGDGGGDGGDGGGGKPVKLLPQSRTEEPAKPRKARSKVNFSAPEWVTSYYQGHNHKYRRVDNERWITACMMERHKPGWGPEPQAGVPPCERCIESLETGKWRE